MDTVETEQQPPFRLICIVVLYYALPNESRSLCTPELLFKIIPRTYQKHQSRGHSCSNTLRTTMYMMKELKMNEELTCVLSW